MKTVNYLFVLVAFAVSMTACNKISYKKTKSGLLYKIVSDGSKESVVKTGDWLKILFVQKINDDSILQTNYGKMPIYQQVTETPGVNYDPGEVFPLLKKGDSVVIVQFVDSLIKKQIITNLPPFMKKGDKLTLTFRVVDVLKSDSLYQADVQREYEKARPAMEKERAEQVSKMKKQMLEQKDLEYAEMEKTGETTQQRKVIEDFLASKNIKAQRTGRGTYVYIKEQGNGPKADSGKYLTVKYSGHLLGSDSVFEANTYPLQLGMADAIAGWDEGLKLFNEGGKGTLYVPGFLGYGKNPPPNSGFRPDEPLVFDVEIVKVSDKKE